MKQLYSSKRIWVFILTFIMIVSSINPIPLDATGEVSTVEKVMYSQDFSGDIIISGKSGDNPEVYVAGGSADVNVNTDEGYLYFLATADKSSASRRGAINIGSLKDKTGFVIELEVKTTNEGHKAQVGLSDSTSYKNTLWAGSTDNAWKKIKLVCTVNEDGGITSQAYVDGAPSGDPVALTGVTGSTEIAYLVLRPSSFTKGAYTCFDNIKVYYTEAYETLELAVDDAEDGETIKVVGNIELTNNVESSANITIDSGVTLDLNGFTLNMNDNFLYSQGDVVDNSGIATEGDVSDDKSGRLLVDAGNCSLAKTNSQVPIYIDDEGYMFATMLGQSSVNKTDDSFTVISRPSFGSEYTELVADATTTGLQFIIRLDWVDGETSYYQPLKYADSLVETVYKDGKAFSATVNGLSEYKDTMKVTVLVKSDLGVEWENNSFYMSTSNK